MRRTLWALVAAATTAATVWATTIESAGSPDTPQVAAQEPPEPREVPTSTTTATKPTRASVAPDPTTTSAATSTTAAPLPPPPPPVPSSETSLASPPVPPPSGPVGATVWDRLATCESGGDWSYNGPSGYDGGLQFHPGTWTSSGGGQFAPFAWQATREQQITIAERLLAASGGRFSAWPGCRAKLGLP